MAAPQLKRLTVRQPRVNHQKPHTFSDILELLLAMPGLQVVLVALAAITWLIGGNVLVAFHYRRLGRSVWSGFRPFAFPFKDFNAREWLILALLLVLSITFIGIAMSINPR